MIPAKGREGMLAYRLCYFGAITFSAFASWGTVHAVFRENYLSAWLWAFLLTLVLGSFVFYVHARAIREAHVRYLYWGLGLHAARIGVIISLFLLLHVWRYDGIMPFIAATLAGYFCFLFFEILGLHWGRRDAE